MGLRGPAPEKLFPESEWFRRNVEMLLKVEPERRENYLTAVRTVCGEAAESALRAVLRKDR